MAGDWIKVEKVTPDKPEIAILARKLGVSHGEAFLNWYRVYAWADSVTDSGVVPFLSHSDADTLARAVPGTCAALASVEIGWLVEEDGGLRFTNWERHNGESAKKRCKEQERKHLQRKTKKGNKTLSHTLSQSCPTSVPENVGQKADEKWDQRREEKSNTTTSRRKRLQPVVDNPPTVEEVSAYASEQNLTLCDPQEFVTFYAKVGWETSSGKLIKDWKAAARGWHDRNSKRGHAAQQQSMFGASPPPRREEYHEIATPDKFYITPEELARVPGYRTTS